MNFSVACSTGIMAFIVGAIYCNVWYVYNLHGSVSRPGCITHLLLAHLWKSSQDPGPDWKIWPNFTGPIKNPPLSGKPNLWEQRTQDTKSQGWAFSRNYVIVPFLCSLWTSYDPSCLWFVQSCVLLWVEPLRSLSPLSVMSVCVVITTILAASCAPMSIVEFSEVTPHIPAKFWRSRATFKVSLTSRCPHLSKSLLQLPCHCRWRLPKNLGYDILTHGMWAMPTEIYNCVGHQRQSYNTNLWITQEFSPTS